MGVAVWVGVVANSEDRLRVFITRDLPGELFFLRSKWKLRVVDLDAFLTYREANRRFRELENASPDALRKFIDERNPKWNDLMPEPVAAGEPSKPLITRPIPIEFRPETWILGDAMWKLRSLPPDDLPPGLGGVGARLPVGPGPRAVSDAKEWPQELTTV
ncbi:MAG: hypothetical protein ABL949_00025 [Fimbriimonadaceae bacterium]